MYATWSRAAGLRTWANHLAWQCGQINSGQQHTSISALLCSRCPFHFTRSQMSWPALLSKRDLPKLHSTSEGCACMIFERHSSCKLHCDALLMQAQCIQGAAWHGKWPAHFCNCSA